MTNKEERITIHKVLYPCKKCSINCNKREWKDCDFYQNYISGITRQEAIEKMAKAMATVSNITYVSEEQWKVVENGFRISAEAALNSLLEVHK